MCEKCVSPKMAAKIDLVDSIGGDFSDGAYLALCQEHGVTMEALEAHSKVHDKARESREVEGTQTA